MLISPLNLSLDDSNSQTYTWKNEKFANIWTQTKKRVHLEEIMTLHQTILQRTVIFKGVKDRSLSSFIKYLDKSNLSNAYNSGMKEYLGIKGNELNYANTGYNIASIIFGLPCAYLMNRYNTRWFILTIEILWTIVTFCFVSIKTPLQMIVLRVILGIVECGHFSAFVFLIGTYYNKHEAARRQVILQAFTVLGPMFATYIQAGASSSLDGTDGLDGWQWTFLIDGIVSVFIIICQIIFVPDILDRLKPNRFFSESDIHWLRARRSPIDQNTVILRKTLFFKFNTPLSSHKTVI